MDGTVNDFFNEIDQIAPPKERKNVSVWQECYDNNSGYSYYWNTKTDEVTWEIPQEYKLWKEQNMLNKSSNLYVPPKSTPLFPSVLTNTKIYKIQEDSNNLSSDDTRALGPSRKQGTSVEHTKQAKKSHINSNQEKAVLIASYGDDSESENEEKKEIDTSKVTVEGPQLPNEVINQVNHNSDSKSDSEDDIDLLTKIQNRAKVLKDLGGELPPDVKKLVETKDITSIKDISQKNNSKKEKKDVTGFSLLAGYGDSEEEDDDAKSSALQPNENKELHSSTLFPISKPIDVAQFNETEPEVEGLKIQNSRAFQRKRRIGIEFATNKVNLDSNVYPKLDVLETDRQGLGFKSDQENGQETSKCDTKTDYLGFKSGGVMFVKSDVASPSIEPEQKEETIQENTDESKNEIMKKIEHTRKTLNEKLTFLSEGREPASPVQVMVIQLETLYEAVKAGGLTTSYLYKWLKETCAELVKLEKEAAPSGWLLQWDRVNKRYYYRNQQTGDSQWEYPQSDIVGGDEAMDISTTPPPPVIDDAVSQELVTSMNCTTTPLEPPPPPRIKSPTPPPPPMISKNVEKKRKSSGRAKSRTPPLPSESGIPLPAEKLSTTGEPLPPGVDSSEIPSYKSSTSSTQPSEDTLSTNDSMGSVLNSFYSDLATLDNNPTVEVVNQSTEKKEANVEPPAKKKKKTKVKLAQGLAMKKKGVSKLVERWKSVQKDY
ncbi:hypothetical protein ILUMI_26957 [Ignelater luminosus]|uniref:WW domain-containing protein n=1 Tax=Ignelater luminosus TaxID=2038154 RepID=A0A8K0C7G8_IGNLU|nr:hypothetical protein ILUMI_26957 [Ignelater luminosus]